MKSDGQEPVEHHHNSSSFELVIKPARLSSSCVTIVFVLPIITGLRHDRAALIKSILQANGSRVWEAVKGLNLRTSTAPPSRCAQHNLFQMSNLVVVLPPRFDARPPKFTHRLMSNILIKRAGKPKHFTSSSYGSGRPALPEICQYLIILALRGFYYDLNQAFPEVCIGYVKVFILQSAKVPLHR